MIFKVSLITLKCKVRCFEGMYMRVGEGACRVPFHDTKTFNDYYNGAVLRVKGLFFLSCQKIPPFNCKDYGWAQEWVAPDASTTILCGERIGIPEKGLLCAFVLQCILFGASSRRSCRRRQSVSLWSAFRHKSPTRAHRRPLHFRLAVANFRQSSRFSS